MAVYVDDMYLHPVGQFGRMKMSHLIADTDEELHAMAARIGVARRWHQAPPRHDSHYDIALTMRAKAIRAGAIGISYRQCSLMTMVRRRTGSLPPPERAEAEWEAMRARAALTPEEGRK